MQIKNMLSKIRNITNNKKQHGYYNKEIVGLARILQHILSDYKRVLEINEVLLKENEELKADNYELNNRINDLLDNIPVQKVKDKIEEILNNGEYRIIFEGDAEFPDEATCIDAQKYIKLEKLQELLEGRK